MPESTVRRRVPRWIALAVLALFVLWGTLPAPAAPSPETLEARSVAATEAKPLHGACPDLPDTARHRPKRRLDLASMTTAEALLKLQRPTFVSPPRLDGPTEVGIALQVLEIGDIDPATNTFSMEGYLDLVWCDPREGFHPRAVGTDREIFLEKDAEKELEHIWWPDFYFVNEVGPRRIENEELILLPDGTVEYRERFSVTLGSEYQMRRFPFDSQQLEVHLQSFAWPANDLVFIEQESILDFSADFAIPEWRFKGLEEHAEADAGDSHYSELLAMVTVERDPGFYVTKIMIPLAIIVMLSWAVFWMIGESLADRMSVSFTGVLTSVAYQFIVSESLPRSIYNTFLDAFVLLSFVAMVLTIVENVVVNSLVLSGRRGVATTVDQLSRIFFPMLYVMGLFGIGVVYLT